MQTDFGYVEEDTLGKPYDLGLLKRLYPFSRPYHRMLAASIALVVLITILDLSLPYVTKVAIDRYIVPALSPTVSDTAEPGNPAARYYTAPLDTPRVRQIVERHPGLFRVENGTVKILRTDLYRLPKADLALLRSKDLSGITRVTGVFLFLVAAGFVLNFVQVMIMEYTGQRMMHDLRVRLFAHIQSLSISFFSKNPVGRLVTRVTNDVQNMDELFTSVISFVFKDLFLLIGIAAVLIAIHWELALVSFTVIPVVVHTSFSFSHRARDIFRRLRVKVAEINTHLSETIAGMRVIQLFCRETDNYRKFSALNHDNYLAGMDQIRIFGIFMPFIEWMGVVALAIVIFFGGRGILDERISLGALVAFISYMRMFFRPIRDIAEKYNILQNAMASAERIFLILDTREQLPGTASGTHPLAGRLERISEVAMDAVSFAYAAGEPVLTTVSFRLRAGQTLAIVGPTGSGKTTLIQLLYRFYDPTAGSVRINGQDIRTLDTAVYRSRMALVMQEPFLFSGTIRENILQGNPPVSDARLIEILQASRCTDLIGRHPHGLDMVLTQGGSAISSGQRQLISIARALARNPDLIILDEATSYIDSSTEEQIQQALRNLMAERTAIVVAHRLSTARHADRILVLNAGRIIESGTHPELMDKQGFYYRLTQL